ncbi:hypothetical protein GCM10023328_47610 [Modestobacter marinus]|uniref:Uncharacterized protein n=1 Tax=Modestobacter marinus TaxID=477641 RepID=A0A846LV73_9ACTN|nr:DUF4200 domain-containing protein [Modestobacter marinus]NIH70262.1 hypothetical protein [Modestobacter marinus]GGL85622.1 hypothetical protein GCM10011589_47540 [Modestobacter marinus]
MEAWVIAVDAPIVTVLSDPDGPLDYATAFGTVSAALIPLIFYFLERSDRKRAQALAKIAEQRRETAERQRNEAELKQRDTELEFRRQELARAAEREEAQEERGRREQAELIHVWSDGWTTDIGIYCMNASKQPVSNVMVYVDLSFVKLSPVEEGLFDTKQSSCSGILDQLPPTGEHPKAHSLEELLDPLLEIPDGYEPLQVKITEVHFTDARGVRWIRNVATNELRSLAGAAATPG